MDLNSVKEWMNQGFAQIIIAAVMAFMIVAILIIVLLPVLNGILSASPQIVTNPLDVGNLSGGGGVLGSGMMNTTQVTLATQIGSSMGLLIIILILMAVLAIIIVVGLFQYFVGGMGGGRQ